MWLHLANERSGATPERGSTCEIGAILRNVIDPLLERGGLEQVTILQGTKAYGNHLQRLPVPARERYPRLEHPNFYWLQEDYLAEQADPVIGIYGAVTKELGLPFSFPGGPSLIWEMVDSRVVAAACELAATDPAADRQHYNVTNGEVFEWRNLWPAPAELLGVEAGPDEPRSVAELLPANAEAWRRVVDGHGLRDDPLEQILGESHHHADFCFAYGAEKPPPPMFVSAQRSCTERLRSGSGGGTFPVGSFGGPRRSPPESMICSRTIARRRRYGDPPARTPPGRRRPAAATSSP